MSNDGNILNSGSAPSGSPDPIDELQLIRYLDGRLEGAAKIAVEDLLRSSAEARRRLDALREEEKLLREALENLSEPSKRLSDKVIATLHSEERFRVQAIRNRHLRRNLIWGVSVAASFFLCVWLMKPRDSMGTVVAGTGGTQILPSLERRPIQKNNAFYERDQIVTAQGQFLRLRITSGSGDAQLDLDERSRLIIEKSKPLASFRLESGRVGVLAGPQDITLHLAQGAIRVGANSVVDIWLPLSTKSEWPAWLLPAPVDATRVSADPAPRSAAAPAIATVISGTISIANDKMPEGISIAQGNRVSFSRTSRSTRAVDLAGSRVIETRHGNSWHASEGNGPQDRALIGIFDHPDFKDLGQRLGMTKNTPQAVDEALAMLQDAMQASAPAARSEKLAAGQQALRAAYEPLAADDERRDFGRMLEGLAHLERGRALMALPPYAENRVAAHASFDAARVAFEESLTTTAAQADAKPDWARQIAAGPSVTLGDLSPANQSALLAAFNHAVALQWLATDETQSQNRGVDAAKEFETLRNDLNKSVEGLAARLAHGLVLQLGARSEKAIEAYAEVLAVPMAGWSDATRRYGDGLKQAALLSLVKLYVQLQQPEKARAAQEDFRILYPLDEASPAAQEIRRVLESNLSLAGDKEMKAAHFALAVERYDEALLAASDDTNSAAVDTRMKLLKALLAAKDGTRARLELARLEKLLPADRLPELKTLAEKADALPDSALDSAKNPKN